MNSANRWVTGVLLLSVVAALALYLWKTQQIPELPDAFASGNSRVEATAVDIATKNGGRVAKIVVVEGDWVKANQLLASMDSAELKAELHSSEAKLSLTKESKILAQSIVMQRKSELTLAQKKLNRSLQMVKKDYVSKQLVDQQEASLQSAKALLQAAYAQVAEAGSSIAVASSQINKIKVRLKDNQLTSPLNGRVLYRLAEPGEILAPGGKVLTVLDLNDVYMTLFLPTHQASRVSIGADARIVLDAMPDIAIPAKVSFIAPRSQFTPRAVETRTEREKLMFRVKVRIDPEILKHYAERVKTGVPGMAYVQLDSNIPWPDGIPPLIGFKETFE